MRRCIPGGSGIPLPDRITTPSEIGKFSDQIIRSLAALRDRPMHAPSPAPRARPALPPCPLGEIYNPSDGVSALAVRGGAVTIGDKNLNVPYYDIDTGTDGQWLLEVSISGVSFNTDDDDSLFLPGIEAVSGSAEWNALSYSGSEDYTDMTNPETPTGTGTAVLPIGLLVVNSGKATFSPTGCGSFLVSQCAGVMSYVRTTE